MIHNLLKNFCLITFALIAPITLPAGGIQRNLNILEVLDNSKEIILISNCHLYSYPETNSKKLIVLDSGKLLSILSQWKDKESNVWLRVKLSSNQFLDNPNIITKGWIKT